MNPEPEAPDLQPPGAGLPPVEAFFGRHVFFPFFCGLHRWDRAELLYKQESDMILDRCVHLYPEDVTRQVLIPRIFGIEDSSRFWSVAMTLEHLMVVGEKIRDVIIALSCGMTISEKADIVAVKPRGGKGHEIIEEFRTFVDDYVWEIQEKVKDRKSTTTHHHPWFGPLTAYQWVCLGALHQRIHRRQIERICLTCDSTHPSKGK